MLVFHFAEKKTLFLGARNLATAFDRDSSGKKRGKQSPASTDSFKSDMKDVVGALAAIDTELENMMGNINVEMKGQSVTLNAIAYLPYHLRSQ